MTIKTLTKTEERTVQEFTQTLKEKLGNDLVLMQLFGSKARDDTHQKSDIDILVVLKEPREKQIDFIFDTVMFLCGEYGVYLSVKIFSEKEFEYYQSIPTLFIRNALREGISLT